MDAPNGRDTFYCPDCGEETADVIEVVDNGDEWKIITCCCRCDTIVYLFHRKKDKDVRPTQVVG